MVNKKSDSEQIFQIDLIQGNRVMQDKLTCRIHIFKCQHTGSKKSNISSTNIEQFVYTLNIWSLSLNAIDTQSGSLEFH